MRILSIAQQASGSFNQGKIIENKPIGFPQDGGFVRPYSSLFYWARAEGVADSTIGLHPHKGFEIMSFVLEGHIRHFDTKRNDWKPLQAGDAQIIRAGSGISHAEHIERGGVIFQIWIDPDLSKTLHMEASYDDYLADSFPQTGTDGVKVIHYAGEQGPMRLVTPGVDIRRIQLSGQAFDWKGDAGVIRSLYVVGGSGMLNGKTIEQDDFIIVDDGADLDFTVHRQGLDIFALTVPVEPGYATYAHRVIH